MCTLHSPFPVPPPHIRPQEGVEKFGAILKARKGNLVCFTPRCGSACLRAHIFRRKLWKLLWRSDFKVGVAPELASNTNPQQHYGNYGRRATNSQTRTLLSFQANLDIDEAKGTLAGLIYVECSPQNGSSYGEGVCTRTSPQWICKNVGRNVQWNRYGTCQTTHV